jgi:hypothetical protein
LSKFHFYFAVLAPLRQLVLKLLKIFGMLLFLFFSKYKEREFHPLD